MSSYKIAIIGDTGSGKTTYAYRLISYVPEFTLMPTIAVEAHPYQVMMADGEHLINIYDFAGKGGQFASSDDHYKGSDAALLFYDHTNKESMHKVRYWEEKFRSICPDKPIIYVANKMDIKGENIMKNSIPISAKHGTNLLAPMREAVRAIRGESGNNLVSCL